jgi:hypothetical protein
MIPRNMPKNIPKNMPKNKIPPDSLERSFEKRRAQPKKKEHIPQPDSFSELPDYMMQIAKQEASAFQDTFWEQLLGIEPSGGNGDKNQKEMMKKMEEQQQGNHTPLNFDNLFGLHQKKEEENIDAVRQRLFKMVQSDTEQAIQERKKEEEERKKKAQMEQDEPQGKQKAKLGQPKKKASTETSFEAKSSKKG